MACLHMCDTLEPSENIFKYLQIISFIRKSKRLKKFFEKFASLRMRVIFLMAFSAIWRVCELIQYLSYPGVSLLQISRPCIAAVKEMKRLLFFKIN